MNNTVYRVMFVASVSVLLTATIAYASTTISTNISTQGSLTAATTTLATTTISNLTVTGPCTGCSTGSGSGSAGGASSTIQFNADGSLAGDPNLTWNGNGLSANIDRLTNPSGLPVPGTPYLGFVAAGHVSTGQYTNFSCIMTRVFEKATDNISAIKLAFVNYALQGGPGTPLYVQAAIEYPAGTVTPVLFNGNATSTIPSGGTVFSDMTPLPVTIPRGADFWVRDYATGSTIYIDQYNNPSYGGMSWYGSSGCPNITYNSGTSGINSSIYSYGPTALIGTTTRPSILIIGDSRTHGQNQSEDSYAAMGYQKLFENYGTVNWGMNGWTAAGVVASSSAEQSMLDFVPYATAVVDAFGVNDLSQGYTPAQLESNVQALASAVYPTPSYIATIEPYTTSVDNWETLGGQTVSSSYNNIESFNSLVRAGMPDFAGFIDLATSTEFGTTGKWDVNGTPDWMTIDGLHGSDMSASLRLQETPVFNPEGNLTSFYPASGGILNGNLITYGNIGIGTSTPTTTLDVNGTTTIENGYHAMIQFAPTGDICSWDGTYWHIGSFTTAAAAPSWATSTICL